MLKQGAISLAVLAVLASCTTASLHQLRETKPRGDAHSIALAEEYLRFSEEEAEQYDWVDSQYFAEKGLLAAYGKPVQPESIASWQVDSSLRPEFQSARGKLEKILTKKHKAKYPKLTAKAQVSFDCWLEQQEEGWQANAISECKKTFYMALDSLKKKLTAKPMPVKVKQGKVEEKAQKPLIRSTAYIVFFDHNKSKLTPLAKDVLQKVTDELKKHPSTQVLLHGHADRSGSEEYNMKLSERRAKAVESALTQHGIKEGQIKYFAFGETDLRVVTGDGIKEPANRRVEIFLE